MTTTTVDASTERFRRSLRRTATFVYQHSAALLAVSVCWFVGSLPVVTSGPATLSACSAIRSIRNGDRVETTDLLRTLRRHGLNAALMSFVPLVVGVLTLLYFHTYTVTGSTQYVVLSITGVYVFSFLSLALVMTFARLAEDWTFTAATKDSYLWIVRNPLLSAMTIVTSGAIVLVGVVSVVGLVVIVPAVLLSFHMEIHSDELPPTVRNAER